MMHLQIETEESRKKFTNSLIKLLYKYDFDGYDLAWQFPKLPVNQTNSTLKNIIDINNDKLKDYRNGFAKLVGDLKRQLHIRHKKTLCISILPHMNVSGNSLISTIADNKINCIYQVLFFSKSAYFDVKSLARNVNFINLLAFDKKTPIYNLYEADISSPIDQDFSGVPKTSIVKDVQYEKKNLHKHQLFKNK